MMRERSSFSDDGSLSSKINKTTKLISSSLNFQLQSPSRPKISNSTSLTSSPTQQRLTPSSPRLLSSSLLSPNLLTSPRILNQRPTSTSTSDSTNSINSFNTSESNQDYMINPVTCPVCLEALSLRLDGEKLVIPVCGHQIHSDCFLAVYGQESTVKSRGTTSLGVCGVCRRDMKVSEDAPTSGRNSRIKFITQLFRISLDTHIWLFRTEFAAMAGLPDATESRPTRSTSLLTGLSARDGPAVAAHDPLIDDDLVSSHLRSPFPTPTGSPSSSRSSRPTMLSNRTNSANKNRMEGELAIVRPIVSVKSEYSTVARSRNEGVKKNLTCMVTISMPSRWPTESVHVTTPIIERDEGYASPRATMSTISTRSKFTPSTPRTSGPSLDQFTDPVYYAKTPPSTQQSDYGTPSSSTNPFLSVVEDLNHRMQDWKGHSLEEFGALRLYDYINVRKEKNNREFLVYVSKLDCSTIQRLWLILSHTVVRRSYPLCC